MIDTKLLRQKILDLAIRGKLVPQDPTDEPASVLLQKIREEKAALVKAGKIKKDKHESFIFKGDDNRYYEKIDGKATDITEEIPFDIPASWCWCRLRSLGFIIGGGTPSTLNPEFWNGDIPWLSPADLTDYHEKYICRGKKNITKEGLAHSSAVLMPPGSILYSSRAPIGYIVIAQNSIATNQGFKSLVPTIKGMSEFFFYVLRAATPNIKQKATGTTFKEISGSEFGETLVPLPPLTEQERIVSQLEALLKYADGIDVDVANLEKHLSLAKQKVLDLAIRGKLVQQDPADEPASELLKKIKAEKEALIKAGKLKRDKHESFIFRGDDNCYYEDDGKNKADISDQIPFDLPPSWQWVRIKNICSLITDGTHQTPEYSNTGVVFLSSTNVITGKIDWENVKYIPEYLHKELQSRLSPQLGDLLLAKNGTIGFSAIVDKDEVFDIYVSLALLRPYKNAVNVEYLHHIFSSAVVQNYFAGEKKGIGLYNLHLENIRETPIPLPPSAEQKRIVSQVEQIFAQLETMQD